MASVLLIAAGIAPLPRSPWLPGQRAGRSFEGTDHVGCDPPSIEVALLSLDALVVKPRGVHASGVEGDVTAQRLIPGRRVRIAPANRDEASPLDDRVHIACGTLEFAPGRACVTGDQQISPHVRRRHIDRWWMAGLEHPEGA